MGGDSPSSDFRARIGEILDSLDLLGTSYDVPGEYDFEAGKIAAGLEGAAAVDEVEALVRAAFDGVSDHVTDERLYAAAAERLWMLKGHS